MGGLIEYYIGYQLTISPSQQSTLFHHLSVIYLFYLNFRIAIFFMF
jgi:hypothetical protein